MIDPKLVDKIVDGIMKFVVALAGHELYAYQWVFCRRIVQALLQHEGATITGLWSRQSGKTTSVADVTIGLCVLIPELAKAMPTIEELRPFKDGLAVGIFAPIKDQAGLSYGRMREILASSVAEEIMADPEIAVEVVSSRSDGLELSNGSLVDAKTASPESKVEGHHYHLIIIDEAQAVDRFKVDKEIEPMRASTNGVMVKIGTAWVSRGGFHSDIEYNIEEHRRGGPRNHFEFPYDMVIAEKRAVYERDRNLFHLAYEKYVQGQIKKFGENSLAFRMNFKLKWQESNLDAVSARAILDCRDYTRVLNVILPPLPGWVRVAGIDVAKYNDSTVCAITDINKAEPIVIHDEVSGEDVEFYNSVLVGLLELQGDFEDHPNESDPDLRHGQYTKLKTFLRDWSVQAACMDATSMGDPVYERMTVLVPEIEWQPFTYSTSSKSDLFKHYLGELDSGRFKIASGGHSKELTEWNNWFEQHRNLEKQHSGQYLIVQAPQPTSTSKRVAGESEYHDDYPNGSALSLHAGNGDILGEISSEPFRAGSRGATRYQSGGWRVNRQGSAARYARR